MTDSRLVVGSARLLPATGPTMMSVLFPDLERTGLLSPHAAIVDRSRFSVDTPLEADSAAGQGRLHRPQSMPTKIRRASGRCVISA